MAGSATYKQREFVCLSTAVVSDSCEISRSIYGEINADLSIGVAVVSEIIQSPTARPYEESPRRCQQSGRDTSHLTRLRPTPPGDDGWSNSSVTAPHTPRLPSGKH